MPRFISCLIVLAVAWSVVPRTAHADPPPSQAQEDDRLHYPATAPAFREHVADHEAKARARMEKHIADAQLGQDKADALRARFQAAVAQVNAKVDEVCADGTVTGEEARSVHELAVALRRSGKGD